MTSISVNESQSTFSNEHIASLVMLKLLRRLNSQHEYRAIITGGRFTVEQIHLDNLIISLELLEGVLIDKPELGDRTVVLPDSSGALRDIEYLIVFCNKATNFHFRYYYPPPKDEADLIRIADDIWNYLTECEFPKNSRG